MRLYGPAILLLACAVWLALFGDGTVFGVIVLGLLGAAVLVQVKEQRREVAARRRDRRQDEP